MADVKDQNLVSLDDGDWEVAEGEPDLRGWTVFTADQRKIGEVDDLLADPAAMKVRYLTIELDREVAGSAQHERTLRVPIGRARVHEEERSVVLDVTATNFKNFESAPSQPFRDDQIKLTPSG
jgi:hypothetical protein